MVNMASTSLYFPRGLNYPVSVLASKFALQCLIFIPHIPCFSVFNISTCSEIFNSSVLWSTVCPTCYRTRHFFDNSKTNEDTATKFEQEYFRCVRNEEECVCSAPNCCDQVKRVAYCRWLQTIRAFWTTLGSQTRCGFTCWDTLILKIPVFGQVKVPTWYLKNPFIQKRMVFGVGCPSST
jgi:hypothetical protein